ncbi:17466_t:CDS:2, partial [Funneliformis geosporum]
MDKENQNLKCVKCSSLSSTKWRKVSTYMLEKLLEPQNNILPEAKIYFVKRHAKPPSNATELSSQRVLISVQPQPQTLRSIHIAIPTNIYKQQQVELASLHD